MADNPDRECTQPDDLRVGIGQLAARWTQADARLPVPLSVKPLLSPLPALAQNLTVPNLPRALRA